MKIVTCALKRSGSHFCQYWMMSHMKGMFVQFDGLAPRSKNIFDRKSAIEIWKDGKILKGKEKTREVAKVISERVVPENSIFSFEDCTLEQALEIYSRYCTETPEYRLSIVRSIYNLLASRIKKWTNADGSENQIHKSWFKVKGVEEIWINNARPKPEWDLMLYDKLLSEKYRDKFARSMGWNKVFDFDPDNIPYNAGGSSFDKRTLPGSEMQVEDRYLEVEIPPVSEMAAAVNTSLFGWSL